MLQKYNLSLMAGTGLVLVACGGGSLVGNSYTSDISVQAKTYGELAEWIDAPPVARGAYEYEEAAAKCYLTHGVGTDFCRGIKNSTYPFDAEWTESELLAKGNLVNSKKKDHEKSGKIRFHLKNSAKHENEYENTKNELNNIERDLRLKSIKHSMKINGNHYPDYKLNCKTLINDDLQSATTRHRKICGKSGAESRFECSSGSRWRSLYYNAFASLDQCIEIAEDVKEAESYYSLWIPHYRKSPEAGIHGVKTTELLINKISNLSEDETKNIKYLKLVREFRKGREFNREQLDREYAASKKAREKKELDRERALEAGWTEFKRKAEARRKKAQAPKSTADLIGEAFGRANARYEQAWHDLPL